MIAFIALWAHALAAVLYAGLALWQLRGWSAETRSRPLVTAFVVMAVWSIFTALLGPFSFLTQFADCARQLAFLAFMYGLMDAPADDPRQRPVKAVYAAVAAAIALQIVIAGLLPRFDEVPAVLTALVSTSQMIGLAVAAGALVLVHNIYGQAAPGSRGAIRLPLIALAMMWIYDLHLYTVALLRDSSADLYAVRGAVLAMLVPLFALGLRDTARLKVQLSRAATFQSLALLAILIYLVLMISASRAVDWAGGDWVQIGQIGLLVLMSAAALVLLPSAKARGWFSVMVQKHLFQHRYDYRQEWLRFTDTVDGEGAIEKRVVKALADLAGSPAGLLFLCGQGKRLSVAGGWNWERLPDVGDGEAPALVALLEGSGHVIDFDRAGQRGEEERRAAALPSWLATLPDAWAGIPLVYCGRLFGLVVIAAPPVRRALDWEDFDLFRAAGRQAASYIAEAHSQEALAQARRFDEFNRRFAFILHDIKNLVSQLSLVARNAERHAENPEFRADMIATLQASVRKMNDLLARLAPGTSGDRGAVRVRPMLVQPALSAAVSAKRRARAVTLAGDARIGVLADPAALEQAVGHLIQNAIDASPADSPVVVTFAEADGGIRIEVADQGTGMSAEFIQTQLFQPFVSTKEGGFGIGAHEARALVEAMGGRLSVDSRPGSGSRFTIHLAIAPANFLPERITA